MARDHEVTVFALPAGDPLATALVTAIRTGDTDGLVRSRS